MASSLRPPVLSLHTRGVSTTSVDSDSSDSSPDGERDDETEYFVVQSNDSRSTICPLPSSKEDELYMNLELHHRLSPVSKLPPELLIAIFSRLTTTSDLRNCMLVSYHWALYCVSILWHRPLCNMWPNVENVARTLSECRPMFPYNEMVKRLNLSAVSQKVSNGTVQAFNNCKSIERLTLTGCSKLSDSGVTGLVEGCGRLQALDVTGLKSLTDATLMAVAKNCAKLQGLNVTDCIHVTDESLMTIARSCKQLKRLKLNGVFQATDQAVLAVAENCRSILEIDLTGCQSIASESVTALLSSLPSLRELRLAQCVELTGAAFTNLSPKLHFDALRILDLTQCEQVRDDAIAKIIPAAPRLRNLVLAKCRHITDRAVDSICKLTKNLHYIHLGHCINLTDAAVINLVKHCNRIRYIDLACCARLTDASVRHLAQLPKLRRIGLVKCQNLTDASILALAQSPLIVSSSGKVAVPSQFVSLERVHLSYCINLTLKGIRALLHNCPRLTHLSLTGVQAFLRDDLTRFCRDAPPEFTNPQREVFCVFSGQGVTKLRDYLTRLAIAEAEQEQRNEIEESLMDPEDSPGADTMSDDGTIDGNEQNMDVVFGPGRHGFPSISGSITGPTRPRTRSVQVVAGQHVEIPFLDHDQMPTTGSLSANSWTFGNQLLQEARNRRQSAFGSFANNDYTWHPEHPNEIDPRYEELTRSANQNRRHTMAAPGSLLPSTTSTFNPLTPHTAQSHDILQDQGVPSSPREPSPFMRSSPTDPSQSLFREDVFARQQPSRPTDEHVAFDANHDAILSTIPDVADIESGDNFAENVFQARANMRFRQASVQNAARTLPPTTPLTYAEFASRRNSRLLEGGSRHRNDAHREAIFRAIMAAEVGDQIRPVPMPDDAEGDVSMTLLSQEMNSQDISSPATSSDTSRVPTPLVNAQPNEEAESHDVTMTQ